MYSELVIRKALYWLSLEVTWQIEDQPGGWVVTFDCDDDRSTFLHSKFMRLLNDYLLREQLDSNTDKLKAAIIQKSLMDLSKR